MVQEGPPQARRGNYNGKAKVAKRQIKNYKFKIAKKIASVVRSASRPPTMRGVLSSRPNFQPVHVSPSVMEQVAQLVTSLTLPPATAYAAHKIHQLRETFRNNMPPPPPITRMVASSANGGGGSVIGNTGVLSRIPVFKSGNPLVDCVINGVAADGQDCRWPDQNSLAPTGIFEMSTEKALTKWCTAVDTTGYNYGSAGVVFGTSISPGYSATAKGASLVEPDFAAAGALIPSMLSSANRECRPCGITYDFQFSLVGLAHYIDFYCYPIMPTNYAARAQSPTGWVTDITASPTDAQIMWGARHFRIGPGSDPIHLVCLPLDNRCFQYSMADADRQPSTADAKVAWTGWVWWFNSAALADTYRVIATTTQQVKPTSDNTEIVAYPVSVRRPNAQECESAMRELARISDAGGTAFLWNRRRQFVNLRKVNGPGRVARRVPYRSTGEESGLPNRPFNPCPFVGGSSHGKLEKVEEVKDPLTKEDNTEDEKDYEPVNGSGNVKQPLQGASTSKITQRVQSQSSSSMR